MKTKSSLKVLLPITLLAFAACKKDTKTPAEDPAPSPPTYNVPPAYEFTNVNYSGQTTRLDQLAEMKAYMSSANTKGTSISAQKLRNMYVNANSSFTNTALNTSGKDIKSKVFLADQGLYEIMMDKLAEASQSTLDGGNGTAGVVVSSTDPSKKYLCDAVGVEWTQVIEKGLMGSLMYYQATAVYLSDSKIGNGVDNSTVKPGEGTAMEHGWDEAFGYFGVPASFPSGTVGIRYWGKYCNDRNALLQCNSAIMGAFIKGRAAISNKDYATRDAQVIAVRENWEKVIAATIISYVNSTKAKFTDDAIRNHNLSEIKGFLMNFKCNPVKKISSDQISTLEGLLGNNFYLITLANLDEIKNTLSTIYGLDSVKNTL